MAATPDDIDPNTISMAVPMTFQRGLKLEEFSPVHRINGYPWRLRLMRTGTSRFYHLSLICDKSNESELWECTATVETNYREKNGRKFEKESLNFSSWGKKEYFVAYEIQRLNKVNVTIQTNITGEHWTLRPSLDMFAPRDGILVIGEEKIYVNKQSLASQSPYFDRLFNGDFMKKNMSEISIGDVEYEEFFNMIKIIYGTGPKPQTKENVYKLLELADRFELKIVQDKVVSCLLERIYNVRTIEMILLSQKYSIPFLLELILSQHTNSTHMMSMCEAPEWDQLSKETIVAIFKRSCTLGPFKQIREIGV